jgi:hypothetical protein
MVFSTVAKPGTYVENTIAMQKISAASRGGFLQGTFLIPPALLVVADRRIFEPTYLSAYHSYLIYQ